MKTLLKILLFFKSAIIVDVRKFYFCGIFFFTAAFLSLQSCKEVDGVRPEEPFVTSGASILTINDDAVPSSIKDMIFQAPGSYISTSSPLYNSNLPLIIIPFQYESEFPWNSFVNKEVIRENFFARGNGSVRDYFYENSWGQFNLEEGFIADVVMLDNNGAYYGVGQPGTDGTRNPALHQEICQKSNVDWSAFDANGNNIIEENEAQVVFMASVGGGGACRPSSVTVQNHSGAYTINESFVFIDCKRNADPNKGIKPIEYNFSTIWHELAHGIFHLPDRYSDYCGSGKTGKYDIMSDNCSWRHMNIYDKMKLGWIRPKIIGPGTVARAYTFPAIQVTPAALILLPTSPLIPSGDEYWILENRFKPSSPFDFDRDIPESGMAIWWVDEVSDQVSLVDAREPSERPQLIAHDPYDDQIGVAFKHQTGDSLKVYTLMPKGVGPRIFRAISPEGTEMRGEF